MWGMSFYLLKVKCWATINFELLIKESNAHQKKWIIIYHLTGGAINFKAILLKYFSLIIKWKNFLFIIIIIPVNDVIIFIPFVKLTETTFFYINEFVENSTIISLCFII
jgi:hypothetical protein